MTVLRPRTALLPFLLAVAGLVLATPPHLLLVVIDDFGWANAGWHNTNGDGSMTPFLDTLESQGVNLDAYHVYKFCAPSRASLLTGRIPGHGISELNPSGDAEMGINLNLTLIPAKLKTAGYATHMIGKWHGGFYTPDYLPVGRGFDTSYGYLNGAETHFSQLFPQDNEPVACQGHDIWNSTENGFGNNGTCYHVEFISPDSLGSCSNGTKYNGYTYVNEAKRLIENHDVEQPFFMYLALQNTHNPLEVPAWYMRNFSSSMYLPRQFYDGMASFADESIFNVTQALKDKGMFNNTIMIVTTDNGASYDNGNNYPLRGAKYNFFEGGVRGSAFVYSELLPEEVRGETYSGLMHISDWYPTLCGLAGVNPNDTGPGRVPVDGFDMWPYLMNPTNNSSPHEWLLLGMANGTNGALIRPDGYKIIIGAQATPLWWGPQFPNKTEYCTGPEVADPTETPLVDGPDGLPVCGYACVTTPCLFNIFDDPSEYNDLAASNPQLLAEMQAQFLQLVAEYSAPNSPNDPDLKDLVWKYGYHMDARGAVSPGCQMVANTGWWRPWVT